MAAMSARFSGLLRPPDIRHDGAVVSPCLCRGELGNGDRREDADNDRDDEHLDKRLWQAMGESDTRDVPEQPTQHS